MKQKYLYLLLLFFTSCTAAKISVPDQFAAQATRLPVKGLNGWMINQRLQFGNYSTSAIKRGWDFSGALQYTKLSLDPQTMLLRVLNIDTDVRKLKEKNKFQYTLEDGKLEAEIFATEQFREDQLVFKSNNPIIGNVNATKKYEYAFTAAILPAIKDNSEPWSVVLMNRYDASQHRGLLSRPYIEEEGYATNGKETITIRPLRLDKVTTKGGKETKVVGGPLLSGYEMSWDGGVVAIVDILDNSLWMANNLVAGDRLIVSSVASSILLKRKQDVEKERQD